MDRRHLSGDSLSLAAVDDIIERGGRQDWARPVRATLNDPTGEIAARIERICAARRGNAEAEG